MSVYGLPPTKLIPVLKKSAVIRGHAPVPKGGIMAEAGDKGPAFHVDRPGNRPVLVLAFGDDDASPHGILLEILSGHAAGGEQEGQNQKGNTAVLHDRIISFFPFVKHGDRPVPDPSGTSLLPNQHLQSSSVTTFFAGPRCWMASPAVFTRTMIRPGGAPVVTQSRGGSSSFPGALFAAPGCLSPCDRTRCLGGPL